VPISSLDIFWCCFHNLNINVEAASSLLKFFDLNEYRDCKSLFFRHDLLKLKIIRSILWSHIIIGRVWNQWERQIFHFIFRSNLCDFLSSFKCQVIHSRKQTKIIRTISLEIIHKRGLLIIENKADEWISFFLLVGNPTSILFVSWRLFLLQFDNRTNRQLHARQSYIDLGML